MVAVTAEHPKWDPKLDLPALYKAAAPPAPVAMVDHPYLVAMVDHPALAAELGAAGF